MEKLSYHYELTEEEKAELGEDQAIVVLLNPKGLSNVRYYLNHDGKERENAKELTKVITKIGDLLEPYVNPKDINECIKDCNVKELLSSQYLNAGPCQHIDNLIKVYSNSKVLLSY